jgi:hypothetical protein
MEFSVFFAGAARARERRPSLAWLRCGDTRLTSFTFLPLGPGASRARCICPGPLSSLLLIAEFVTRSCPDRDGPR